MFSYLLERPSAYYFRIRVPDDLREKVGKRFIVRSLKTKNLRHASHQASTIGMQIYFAFQKMRSGERGMVDINKLLKTLEDGKATELIIRKASFGNAVLEGIEANPDNPEDVKMFGELLATVRDSLNTAPAPAPAPVATPAPQYFLKDEIAAYIADCTRRKLAPKTVKAYASLLDVLLSALGNVPVGEITDPDIDRYIEMVTLLPATASQRKCFRDLKTVEEVIRMNEVEDEPAIGVKVIQQHINRAKAFFEFVIVQRRHLTGLNPLAGRDLLSASAMKKSDRQRFENEHLVKIFDATTYGEHNDKPSDWFLPLLALFTGARINELCQLRVEDVFPNAEIPYIFIRATEPTQSLKTETSKRHIPLHSVLLASGFLDYVEDVRAQGLEFVFPHLTYSETSGYAAQASERCNGYLKTAGVKSRTRVFHSFRHTFCDELKQQGLAPAQVAELSGHAEEGTLGTVYTNVTLLPIKAAQIEKLKFPVDFAALKYEGRFKVFLERNMLKMYSAESMNRRQSREKHLEAKKKREERALLARGKRSKPG